MKMTINQAQLRDPKYLVTKTDCKSGQKLVFGPHLLPGWVCTLHQAYNNIERTRCKFSNCQQQPTFTLEELQEFIACVERAGGRISIGVEEVS